MVDHPEPEAEEALVALGGVEPACLTLTKLWHDAVADGGFLEEWVDDAHLSRSRLSWLGMALERLRTEGFHEFLRSLPPARAERMGRFLHRFPRPWLDRAAAAVAEAVVEGDGVCCDHASTLLAAATAQRVRRAFVASIGAVELSLGAAALVPLSVVVDQAAVGGRPGSMAPDGSGRPVVTGRIFGPARGVTITVAPTWLHRVWAAGAAVVDAALVLDISPDRTGDLEPQAGTGPVPGAHGEALVVTWSRGEPVATTERVHHDGTRWTRLGAGSGR